MSGVERAPDDDVAVLDEGIEVHPPMVAPRGVRVIPI